MFEKKIYNSYTSLDWAISNFESLVNELEGYVAKHRARAGYSPLTICFDDEYSERTTDIEIAIPITHPIPSFERIGVREVSEVPLAACVTYTGGYERSEEAINALMIWIEANGYRSCGPMREVYLRFGAYVPIPQYLPSEFMADQIEHYVSEIQLPIRKVSDLNGGKTSDKGV